MAAVGCRESPKRPSEQPSSSEEARPSSPAPRIDSRAVSLTVLIDSLTRIKGEFTSWEQGRWEFTGDASVRRAFDAYGDSAVVRLVECLDRIEPAQATVRGRRVPMGVMCYWTLRRLAYYEWYDDPEYREGWPGEIPPTASPEELRAAREAWSAVVREKRHVLT